MLQCVAVCVRICMSAANRAAKTQNPRFELQYRAVCGGVLQCVAVCGSMLQCVFECVCQQQIEEQKSEIQGLSCSMLHCGTVCCSVLQCVFECLCQQQIKEQKPKIQGRKRMYILLLTYTFDHTLQSTTTHCNTLQHTNRRAEIQKSKVVDTHTFTLDL